MKIGRLYFYCHWKWKTKWLTVSDHEISCHDGCIIWVDGHKCKVVKTNIRKGKIKVRTI